ncbi:MAG: class I tRNA ligase family protein, partial [Myxococcales bacterium]|nr:class I tRNA ligase family protein [Myxococcales bacterium]
LVPADITCPKCGEGRGSLEREFDILDVWFESGSSAAAVLGERGGLKPKADLYLEGSDQHRGWFQSSLLIAVGTRDEAPFNAVLTHGFVVDTEGRKYSKSSKNFESPDKIINSLGAEILRLWVAAVDYRSDITLSPEILKRMTDAYRRLRNTSRFLLGNLSDFDPEKHAVSLETLPPLDAWALDRLGQLVTRIDRAYADYEFHIVFHRLLEYCTVDLSQNYLDVLKDRLYCEAPDDPSRRASQTVMYEILRAITLMSAPVLAFTSEEVWAEMPKRAGDPDSVHLAIKPTAQPSWENAAMRGKFEWLFSVRSAVQEAIEARRPKSRGERKPGQIGSSQEAKVTLLASPETLERLRIDLDLLPELFIVSAVELSDGAENNGLPSVEVSLASGEKCPRCWNYRDTFGMNGKYDDICGRCAGVALQLDSI